MPASARVNVVNHGGERGGFSGPRRSRDEHKPSWLVRDLLHNSGELQLIKRRNPIGNDAERDVDDVSLKINIHAETAEAFHGERHIAFQALLKNTYLFFV